MQFTKHLLLAIQFVVKLIVAVGRRQERVPVRDEQIENVDYLNGQMENIAFFYQIRFLIHQKF